MHWQGAVLEEHGKLDKPDFFLEFGLDFAGSEVGPELGKCCPLKKFGRVLQIWFSLADNDCFCVPLNMVIIYLKYLNTWKVSLWISLRMLTFLSIPHSKVKLGASFSTLQTPVRPADKNEQGHLLENWIFSFLAWKLC